MSYYQDVTLLWHPEGTSRHEELLPLPHPASRWTPPCRAQLIWLVRPIGGSDKQGEGRPAVEAAASDAQFGRWLIERRPHSKRLWRQLPPQVTGTSIRRLLTDVITVGGSRGWVVHLRQKNKKHTRIDSFSTSGFN